MQLLILQFIPINSMGIVYERNIFEKLFRRYIHLQSSEELDLKCREENMPTTVTKKKNYCHYHPSHPKQEKTADK